MYNSRFYMNKKLIYLGLIVLVSVIVGGLIYQDQLKINLLENETIDNNQCLVELTESEQENLQEFCGLLKQFNQSRSYCECGF